MVRDAFYRGIVAIGAGVIRFQGLKVHVSGAERIPREGGAVIAINHTGYMDFVFAGIPAKARGRLVRYMAKSSVFHAPVAGQMMRAMKHIPVDRIDGRASLSAAVAAARDGELVGVFPEGTISRSFEVKNMRNGAVRIAHEAGVPLIPLVMFGSQRVWTKGQPRNIGRSKVPLFISVLEPWSPTGEDVAADTARLRSQMTAGVTELWHAYQREYGEFPAGEPWVPARFGGAAPAPEVTEVEDRAVENERHRVRKLTEDLQQLSNRVLDMRHDLMAGIYEAYDQAKDKLGSGEGEEHGAQRKKRVTAQEAGAQKDGLEEQAKEKKKDSAGLSVWVKDNLDGLAAEASRGVKEGSERVSGAIDQLRENVTRLYQEMAATSTERYEGSKLDQALTSLAAQSRAVLDRLPHRASRALNRMPEAVCCDLDGTLLNREGVIPEGVRAALRRCYDAGVPVILTSEFGEAELRRAAAGLGFPVAAIGYCGALSMDAADGRVVGTAAFDTAALDHLNRTVARLREELDPGAELHWRHVDGRPVLGAVMLSDRAEEPAAEVSEWLSDALAETATVNCSAGHRIDVTPAGVNKAAAVGVALERVGATWDGLLSFGDSPADLPVLTLSGTAVATANATSDVLQACPLTAPTNDEGGVGEILDIIERNIADHK